MSTLSPELAPILSYLTQKIEDIEKAHDAIRKETCGPDLTTGQGARGLTDADCDEADVWEYCREDLIEWIAEREKLSPHDLREYAHRKGTIMGVKAWRRQTGDRTEYRDLSWITPKLVKLERLGEAAIFLANLWRKYPTVGAKLREVGVRTEQDGGGDGGQAGDAGQGAEVLRVVQETAAEVKAVKADVAEMKVNQTTHPMQPASPERPRTKEYRTRKLAEALMVKKDHPEWSDARVAREVGVDRSTLCRSEEYRRVVEVTRGDPDQVPKGNMIVPDEPKKPIGVEARAPGVGDRIPGSRCYRGRCPECGTETRVEAPELATTLHCEACR